MKLYGSDVCPYVHRVRLALAEKDLEHEYVAIDLRNKPEWYHQVLPSGKVPLLEHDGFRVWESIIVCEYLEDAFPQRRLLPQEPGPKAEARLWIDWVSNSLVPPFYKLLTAQREEERAELRETLLKALEKLETDGFRESEWIHGEELSLVDLATYPWFERWGVLEHYRDLAVPERFVKVRRWRERLAGRQTVERLAQDPSLYVEQYQHYAQEKVSPGR